MAALGLSGTVFIIEVGLNKVGLLMVTKDRYGEAMFAFHLTN